MEKTPIQRRNAFLGNRLIHEMEKRNFEAYYVDTAEAAVKKALSLIPEGSSVSWGGSMTIRNMGLTKAIHEGNYEVIDRDLGKSPEEIAELHRKALTVDTFITSANAISENGKIFNIDGTGNRVAAICFGPKSVIFICGMNKVARDDDAAMARIRSYAAPVNAIRIGTKTPCAINGSCGDCLAPDCICSEILITRLSKPTGRIKVILVGEELGY